MAHHLLTPEINTDVVHPYCLVRPEYMHAYQFSISSLLNISGLRPTNVVKIGYSGTAVGCTTGNTGYCTWTCV